MSYLLSAVFTALPGFAAVLFFDTFFERRWQGPTFWGCYALWVTLDFALLNSLQLRPSVLHTLLGIGYFFAISFSFRGKLAMKFLFSVIWYATTYLMDFLFALGTLALFHMDMQDLRASPLLFTTECLISAFSILLVAMAVKSLSRLRKGGGIAWPRALLSGLYPLATLMVLLAFFDFSSNNPLGTDFLSGCLVFLIAATLAVLLLVDWMEKAEQKNAENLSLTQQLSTQAENMDALANAYAAQRKMTHNFNAYLSTLNALLQRNETAEAAAYLKEVQANQTERILIVNSHNPALDAILNQKAYRAVKYDIDIQFEINNLADLKINPVDCTVLLSNLLDNAM
ncbi:MAG: hypothetical protein PHO10_04305 [Gemmiger sp.]|nr:hypothetical protein [Gemmiger sp.]